MTDAFVDKLWEELDRAPCCPECQSLHVCFDGEHGHGWYCNHCTWRGEKTDRIATLTESELDALVERVRGEAKQERVETLADIRSMVAQIAGRYVADKKMKAKVLDKIDAFIAKEAR